MKYMIHAAPPRMWYVDEFLIPSMIAQGIHRDDIEVWIDTDGKGNLFSCMESFRMCGKQDGGIWHLQDDVIISRDFAARTKEHDLGIVCGFACKNFGAQSQNIGRVPAVFMWYSFQCIRIPNDLAGECADWFYSEAQHRTKYVQLIAERKHDDQFWRDFINERHRELWVTNLAPNIVDHVDYLIGGTLINRLRSIKINRAAFWEEEYLVKRLSEQLKKR